MPNALETPWALLSTGTLSPVRAASWVIFLSLILEIDWLFLLFLKIAASRHSGGNK